MAPKTYEIPTEMREFAEKSVEQAKKAFDGFIGAAQKATDSVGSHASTVNSSASDISRKAFDFAGSNVNAAFALAQNLVRAKDVQEVMALQTSYLKSQVETLQKQMQELTSDVTKPVREATKEATKKSKS